MAKQAGINRFFSPRVQGQFAPQFVEEQYPFEEEFLVRAGQQQRIDDLMAQATEIGRVATRPLEGDIEGLNNIYGNLQQETEEILQRNAGDPTNAAKDISKALSRTLQNPFFRHNQAALAQAESFNKIREQILGRGQEFLGLDTSAIDTPLQDPSTGEFNQIGSNIVQRPDFEEQRDKTYDDIKAKKTETFKKEVAPGVFESVTETVLTDEDLRKTAKEDVDRQLKVPFWAESLKLEGVQTSGIRKATEEFLYEGLKNKAQNDRETQYVKVPEIEKPVGDRYKDWGIGQGITAKIERNEDGNIKRVFTTMVPEVQLDAEGSPRMTFGKNPIPQTKDVPKPLTFTSENDFTILQDNKAGTKYELFVSPQEMWSMTSFGKVIINANQEDFELEAVRDLMVSDKDITINGVEYKAGQPLSDEDLLGRSDEELQALQDSPSIHREFFAVGRINKDDDDEESVAIPYQYVKRIIKSKTREGSEGGFELNEDDFFKEELNEDESGTAGFYSR